MQAYRTIVSEGKRKNQITAEEGLGRLGGAAQPCRRAATHATWPPAVPLIPGPQTDLPVPWF